MAFTTLDVARLFSCLGVYDSGCKCYSLQLKHQDRSLTNRETLLDISLECNCPNIGFVRSTFAKLPFGRPWLILFGAVSK